MGVHIGLTRNGAVKAVTISKIGSEQRPKYLESNPLLFEANGAPTLSDHGGHQKSPTRSMLPALRIQCSDTSVINSRPTFHQISTSK